MLTGLLRAIDASLDADAFDDEGFFRTGDLGVLDEEGALHLDWRGLSLAASTALIFSSRKALADATCDCCSSVNDTPKFCMLPKISCATACSLFAFATSARKASRSPSSSASSARRPTSSEVDQARTAPILVTITRSSG